jgi:hypothetical protein
MREHVTIQGEAIDINVTELELNGHSLTNADIVPLSKLLKLAFTFVALEEALYLG